MNDIFSLRRFWLLTKKIVYENALLFCGVMILAIIFLLFIFFILEKTNPNRAQEASMAVGSLFYGTILTAILFNQFSSKAKFYNYLSLPCSTIEKWLVTFLLIFVIFVPIFIMFHQIIATIYIDYHKSLPLEKYKLSIPQNELKILPLLSTEYTYFYKIFLLLQSFSMVLALFFNKNAYLKGALLLLGGLFLVYYANDFIANLLFDEKVGTNLFRSVHLLKKQDSIFLPENTQNYFSGFIYLFLPLALWFISYVRLKEKEV